MRWTTRTLISDGLSVMDLAFAMALRMPSMSVLPSCDGRVSLYSAHALYSAHPPRTSRQ